MNESKVTTDPKDQTAIVPDEKPLPPVEVEEIAEGDLDEVDGGCSLLSCYNTCGNTGGKKETANNV